MGISDTDQKSGERLSRPLRDQIEERIATGVYPPGYRLDEQDLADMFKVSRTPVREALIQLAAAGFVEIRPRRGAIVADVPATRICEMFDVMAELEAMCARLAARRITPQEQQALLAAHKACAEAEVANDPDAYFELNERFHRAIYAASHASFLIEQAEALHRRLRTYRRLQLRVRNRLHNSFDEHGRIVEAILAGDADKAATSIRDHVLVQGERFSDLIASLASLKEKS